MPQFFFDLHDDRDCVGANLADDASAHRYAVQLAGEIIRDLKLPDRQRHYWRMDVRRGEADPVVSLAFEIMPSSADSALRPRAHDCEDAIPT